MSGAGRGTPRQGPFTDTGTDPILEIEIGSGGNVTEKTAILPSTKWVKSYRNAAILPVSLSAVFASTVSLNLPASTRRISVYLVHSGTNNLVVNLSYSFATLAYGVQEEVERVDDTPFVFLRTGEKQFRVPPDSAQPHRFILRDIEPPLNAEGLGLTVFVREEGGNPSGSITDAFVEYTNTP